MKRLFLIFGILSFFTLSAYAADNFYSSLFMIRFLKCLPTNMSFSTVQGEVTLKQQRSILNWHEHMCGYKVVETIDKETTIYECKLSRDQVTAFAQAMRNDPEGTGSAKSYWNSLKTNTSSCTVKD